MSSVLPTIDAIEKLLAAAPSSPDRPHARAQLQLESLITTIGLQELPHWEADLRKLILTFQPKRRRVLLDRLDRRLGLTPQVQAAPSPAQGLAAEDEIASLEAQLRTALTYLSEHHIFQWTDFYREIIADFADEALRVDLRTGQRDLVLSAVRRQLAEHSNAIFTKG